MIGLLVFVPFVSGLLIAISVDMISGIHGLGYRGEVIYGWWFALSLCYWAILLIIGAVWIIIEESKT